MRRGGATGGRESGEERENRSLVSPLLYFTVAVLPAGAIGITLANKRRPTQTVLFSVLE